MTYNCPFGFFFFSCIIRGCLVFVNIFLHKHKLGDRATIFYTRKHMTRNPILCPERALSNTLSEGFPTRNIFLFEKKVVFQPY